MQSEFLLFSTQLHEEKEVKFFKHKQMLTIGAKFKCVRSKLRFWGGFENQNERVPIHNKQTDVNTSKFVPLCCHIIKSLKVKETYTNLKVQNK